MKNNKFFAGAARGVLAVMLLALLVTAGCGGSSGGPSVESRLAIENVGKWYQVYRAKHAGKPPEDEATFLEFINGELTGRGQAAVTAEQLLTSPGDGAPYVIMYGKVVNNNPELNIVAYEQNGADGMRLIVTELARSRIVDETELQSLVPSD